MANPFLPSVTKILQNMRKDIATPIDEHSLSWILIPSVRDQLPEHCIRMPIGESTRHLELLSADVESDSVHHR